MTEWRDLLAGRWQAFALIMLGMWLMAADSLLDIISTATHPRKTAQ